MRMQKLVLSNSFTKILTCKSDVCRSCLPFVQKVVFVNAGMDYSIRISKVKDFFLGDLIRRGQFSPNWHCSVYHADY